MVLYSYFYYGLNIKHPDGSSLSRPAAIAPTPHRTQAPGLGRPSPAPRDGKAALPPVSKGGAAGADLYRLWQDAHSLLCAVPRVVAECVSASLQPPRARFSAKAAGTLTAGSSETWHLSIQAPRRSVPMRRIPTSRSSKCSSSTSCTQSHS